MSIAKTSGDHKPCDRQQNASRVRIVQPFTPLADRALTAIAAEKILGELKERHQKIVDSDGTSNKFSTQQLAARINATTATT